MIFAAETRDNGRIEYRDTKRYLWVFSFIVPLYTIGAVAWYALVDPNPWVAVAPLFLSFVVTPLLDLLFGEDTSNPPEAVVEQMAEDDYYRRLLHLSVPIYWAAFLLAAWLVGTQNLPWWGVVAMAVSAGYSSGTAITVGHELGHKMNAIDRWMAKIVLAVSSYGHFCIEHNRGHHTNVATAEDCSSARFDESIYAFALRDIPGALRGALALEKRRLERKGLSFWHPRNEILHSWAITAVAYGLLLIAFGWVMLPFLAIHTVFAWFALTQANYVEHYGLLRERRANGRYEPVRPEHSWNTNHVMSNLMLFHLQRHSDHHANPMRPYQSLRNFDELPRLPSGYPGCFVLAAVPPLWRRVMNPKVLEMAGGDMGRVNTGVL